MLDVRLRAFLIAAYFAVAGVALFGETHKATFHGSLFPYVSAMPGQPVEECRFMLVGDGDSDSIYLMGANNEAYICPWLNGTHKLKVTLETVE